MLKFCPNCKKPLAQRQGKFGMFWGCTGYPECRFIEKTTRSNYEQKPQPIQNFEEIKQNNINKAIENKSQSMLYYNSLNGALAKTDTWDIKEIEKKRDQLIEIGRKWFLESGIEDGTAKWNEHQQGLYNDKSKLDDIRIETQL